MGRYFLMPMDDNSENAKHFPVGTFAIFSCRWSCQHLVGANKDSDVVKRLAVRYSALRHSLNHSITMGTHSKPLAVRYSALRQRLNQNIRTGNVPGALVRKEVTNPARDLPLQGHESEPYLWQEHRALVFVSYAYQEHTRVSQVVRLSLAHVWSTISAVETNSYVVRGVNCAVASTLISAFRWCKGLIWLYSSWFISCVLVCLFSQFVMVLNVL